MNKSSSLFSFNSGSSATVIWDLELCPLPRNFKGYQAVRRIKDFVLAKGLQLTQIVAIGSSRVQINQSELEDCGVNYQRLHSKSPAAADISILHEIVKLVYFHRPPHNIVLITGDRDFSKILNFLDQVHYNVSYIHAKDMSDVMQFSINDRTPWWEVLGCKVSDIEFLSPYTLEDVEGKPSSTSVATTPVISALKQYAVSTNASSKINGDLSKAGKSSLTDERASLEVTANKVKVVDSAQSSKTDKSVSSAAIKSIHLVQKSTNGSSQGSTSNSTATITAAVPKQQRIVNYDVLINFLRSQDHFLSFFGDIGTHCRKIGSNNGFSTLKDYLYHAESDGIVLLSNKNEPSGHVIVKLAPHLCPLKPQPSAAKSNNHANMFDELVALLEASKTRALTMSDIGMTTRNINKRHGFAYLKSYLAVAEKVGIIKTTGREEKNGRIIVHLLKNKAEVAKCAASIEAALSGNIHFNPALVAKEASAAASAEPHGCAASSTSTTSVSPSGNSPNIADGGLAATTTTSSFSQSSVSDSAISNAAAAVRSANVESQKKAFWDLGEFMRSMPQGQFVSAAHIAKYCPSISRKMVSESFQSFLYCARDIGLIELTVEGGDDKDLAGFMVQLNILDKVAVTDILKNYEKQYMAAHDHQKQPRTLSLKQPLLEKAGVTDISKNLEKQDMAAHDLQKQKRTVPVMAQKQPLFVPPASNATTTESLLASGDLELPKSSRISIRPPPGAANSTGAVTLPKPTVSTEQPVPPVPTLDTDSDEKKEDLPKEPKGSVDNTLLVLPDAATMNSAGNADVARAVEPETNSKPFTFSSSPSVFYAPVPTSLAAVSSATALKSTDQVDFPAFVKQNSTSLVDVPQKSETATAPAAQISDTSVSAVESVLEAPKDAAQPLVTPLPLSVQQQVGCDDESSGYSGEHESETKYGIARFFWPHPGTSVAITGSWDQWNSETLMVKKGTAWHLEKTLPHGRYEYEFVVDGNQMVDDNQQYVEDDESCHNLVFVSQ